MDDEDVFDAYIVVLGDMAVGHSFYGPFPSFDQAMLWGERNAYEWTVVPLEEPVELQDEEMELG